MPRIRTFLLAGMALLATACRDAGPGAPSTLTLAVVSPNGPEGAALIRLVGAVDTVDTDAPGWLLLERRQDTTWVFIGLEDPGALAIRVRRPASAGDLEAQLLEVAGPDDRVRELTDYGLVRP